MFRVFGECPLGLRYKWVWTPDMEFYVMAGNAYSLACAADWKPTASGVLAPTYTQYRKVKWSEVHGPCWILAKWWKPMSETDWIRLYGAQIPWPKQGEYHAVENIKLRPGVEPSENTTRVVCWLIAEDNKKTLADHVREGDEIVASEQKQIENEITDEAADLMTAFGKVPGSRSGGVSLPTTRFDTQL